MGAQRPPMVQEVNEPVAEAPVAIVQARVPRRPYDTGTATRARRIRLR